MTSKNKIGLFTNLSSSVNAKVPTTMERVSMAGIIETPGVFERVRQSLHRRLTACIAVDEQHIEHLL